MVEEGEKFFLGVDRIEGAEAENSAVIKITSSEITVTLSDAAKSTFVFKIEKDGKLKKPTGSSDSGLDEAEQLAEAAHRGVKHGDIKTPPANDN